MGTTAQAVVRRLRQARAAALRAQLAVTAAQILFWGTLIGVFAGLALRAWRRRSRSVTPTSVEAEPTAPPPTS